MSHAVGRWAPGDVLRITKMVNDHGVEISNDAWGIVLDDEDMMVFQFAEAQAINAPGGWFSQVCPLGWADEETQIAEAEAVPADVPKDFWPLVARLALK